MPWPAGRYWAAQASSHRRWPCTPAARTGAARRARAWPPHTECAGSPAARARDTRGQPTAWRRLFPRPWFAAEPPETPSFRHSRPVWAGHAPATRAASACLHDPQPEAQAPVPPRTPGLSICELSSAARRTRRLLPGRAAHSTCSTPRPARAPANPLRRRPARRDTATASPDWCARLHPHMRRRPSRAKAAAAACPAWMSALRASFAPHRPSPASAAPLLLVLHVKALPRAGQRAREPAAL